MFRCDIYRTGNPESLGSGDSANEAVTSVGSNAPENFSKTIFGEELALDPSPIVLDLDRDGFGEIITYYMNTNYNISTGSRPFENFVMAVKYKSDPTEMEQLEFGKIPYIRDWYFVIPEEMHTSFSAGDLDKDGRFEVVFGCDDGNIYALNHDGSKLFSFKTGGKVRSTPAVADIDGDGNLEIVFGSDDGDFYALTGNGTLKWNFSVGSEIESSPSVFSVEGSVYISFGSNDGRIYMLDSYGNKICSYQTGGRVISSPLPFENKLAFGSEDSHIYIINTSCSVMMNYTAGGKIISSPSVFESGFAIGSQDSNIYIFNETDLSLFPMGSSVMSTPMSINGTLTIITSNGTTYLLKNGTKNQLWANERYVNASCSPAIIGGTMFSCFFKQKEGESVMSSFAIIPAN